jgi:hypothetical protein
VYDCVLVCLCVFVVCASWYIRCSTDTTTVTVVKFIFGLLGLCKTFISFKIMNLNKFKNKFKMLGFL